MGDPEPQRMVASVLVVAVDANIESLMGQLVAFAGHRPVYDATQGAGGEAIRRLRPEVVLLDISLIPEVVDLCLAAADETGTRPVLTSSVGSSAELEAEAQSRQALHFALPGGPKPLAAVIERALHEWRGRARITVPVPQGDSAMHRALCAALAGVARARVLAIRRDHIGATNGRHYLDADTSADEMQQGRAALRAAVTDLARQLRLSSVPEPRVVDQVRASIRDCAAVVGAEEAMPALLGDAEAWARDAYLEMDAGQSVS